MESTCLAAPPGECCASVPRDLGHELTQGFAGRYVRHKAREVIGRYGFVIADLLDLEQELILRLMERLEKFDPTRAPWNSFVVAVVDRQLATILAGQRAQKRRHAVVRPLAKPFADDDASRDLGELYEASPHARQSPVDGHKDLDLVDLEHDIAVVKHRLPYKLRIVWDWLQWDSVRQTARGLRVSPQTIYHRIKKLRAAFIAAGLEDSCQKNETLRS